MPDISDRTKREVALAAKLETIFVNARDAGPDLSWTAFRQAVSDTLREDLSALFVVVWFLLASDETKIGSTPDAIVSLFFDVARPDRIASQLAETSKSQLATGSPPASVFTPGRASTIAVTEITATITAAEAAANASNAATTQRNERHPDRAGQPMTADEIERNLPFEDRAAPLRTSPNLLAAQPIGVRALARALPKRSAGAPQLPVLFVLRHDGRFVKQTNHAEHFPSSRQPLTRDARWPSRQSSPRRTI